MDLRVLLLSGCAVLTGCQITPDVVEPNKADIVAPANTFSTLKAVDVEIPSKTKVTINQYSQLANFSGIDSPVAAFKVPANQGSLELTFTSEIGDTVFVPYIKLFDDHGIEVAYIEHDKFEYKTPRLNENNRFETQFSITPLLSTEEIIVVFYTDKSQLGRYTEIIHPARLDAEARGNYLPEVKDIPIPHALMGAVVLEVESTGLKMEEQQVMSSKVDALPETQNYYLSAIQTAVESNNLDKALSLLDEAKALNIEGAQEVFIKAVNKK